MTKSMRIANRIRGLRCERRWTQKELAERIGVSEKAVASWESGSRAPRLETAIKLAETFGCTLQELVAQAVTTDGRGTCKSQSTWQ